MQGFVVAGHLSLAQITFGANFKDTPGVDFEALVDHARALKAPLLQLRDSYGSYAVLVHSPEALKLIRSRYTAEDLIDLQNFLQPVTTIRINERGLIQAADREIEDEKDPTHYDAIWVRDSLWAYLGLASQKDRHVDASRVLTTLLDYFATPDQLRRLADVTHDPSLLEGGDGRMNAVHVRFDGHSPAFDDVRIEGQPQNWNHKQNDALGLFLDLVIRAVGSGEIALESLREQHLTALAFLPAYFSRIRFYEMEDAGCWEEIERTNTSSIGLITSGLERLQETLAGSDERQKAFRKSLMTAAKERQVADFLSPRALENLIDLGYARLFAQLQAGGESPLYPLGDARHRKSDAALLNLIYPAQLRRLKPNHLEHVLALVKPLVGQIGIRRYLNDSYQSGNFWYNQFQTIIRMNDDNRGTRSAQEFAEREKQFIPNSEAQWFFDSWYSKALGIIAQATQRQEYRTQQIQFFNRALGQVTGDPAQQRLLGADGRLVPRHALPESYNSILSGPAQFFLPSPITPLNWAKAALALALADLRPETVK